jgi:hypothetical protein
MTRAHLQAEDRLRILDPRHLQFRKDHDGKLLATVAGQYADVRVELRCAFPLTAPDLMIGVFRASDSNEEIGIVEDLRKLDEESCDIARKELNARHSIPEIVRIRSIRERHGRLHFDAETDHGPRRFVIAGAHDSVEDRPGDIQILTDTNGNRVIIPGREKLDRRSRLLVERFL